MAGPADDHLRDPHPRRGALGGEGDRHRQRPDRPTSPISWPCRPPAPGSRGATPGWRRPAPRCSRACPPPGCRSCSTSWDGVPGADDHADRGQGDQLDPGDLVGHPAPPELRDGRAADLRRPPDHDARSPRWPPWPSAWWIGSTRSIDRGYRLPCPKAWIVGQNKWRAARYGIDAEIIVDEEGKLAPLREAIVDLVEELTPVARRLGCEDELPRGPADPGPRAELPPPAPLGGGGRDAPRCRGPADRGAALRPARIASRVASMAVDRGTRRQPGRPAGDVRPASSGWTSSTGGSRPAAGPAGSTSTRPTPGPRCVFDIAGSPVARAPAAGPAARAARARGPGGGVRRAVTAPQPGAGAGAAAVPAGRGPSGRGAPAPDEADEGGQGEAAGGEAAPLGDEAPAAAAATSTSEPPLMPPLRVATFNIKHGDDGGGRVDLRRLADGLRSPVGRRAGHPGGGPVRPPDRLPGRDAGHRPRHRDEGGVRRGGPEAVADLRQRPPGPGPDRRRGGDQAAPAGRGRAAGGDPGPGGRSTAWACRSGPPTCRSGRGRACPSSRCSSTPSPAGTGPGCSSATSTSVRRWWSRR